MEGERRCLLRSQSMPPRSSRISIFPLLSIAVAVVFFYLGAMIIMIRWMRVHLRAHRSVAVRSHFQYLNLDFSALRESGETVCSV